MASSETISKEYGVRMKPADFFFHGLVEQHDEQYLKMREIQACGVKGFRRDPDIIHERGVSSSVGAVDAYEHLAPIIDTDRAMVFLMNLVKSKGAKLITRTIHGDLLYLENDLRREFSADIIINATGLASKHFIFSPLGLDEWVLS